MSDFQFHIVKCAQPLHALFHLFWIKWVADMRIVNVFRDLISVFRFGFYENRFSSAYAHRLRVSEPVRSGDYHLVAGVDNGV